MGTSRNSWIAVAAFLVSCGGSTEPSHEGATSGDELAVGAPVSALDSIEAPVRWRKANLTDGVFAPPPPATPQQIAVLEKERGSLFAAAAAATVLLPRGAEAAARGRYYRGPVVASGGSVWYQRIPWLAGVNVKLTSSAREKLKLVRFFSPPHFLSVR